MIEMFEVNNINTTTTTTTTLTNDVIENAHQSHSSSNLSSLAISSDGNCSMLLTDIVMNTTVAVVDYATQWLTTTIATAVTNLSSFSDETTTSMLTTTDSSVNYSTPALNTSYLNLGKPASYNDATIINTPKNYHGSASTPTLSSSAETYILNADLIESNYKLTDDSYYEEELNDCHPNNPNFNCSRMDYVVFILGPQTMPLYKALLITILYGGIFITGFLGNVLVCVVIVKHSAMHTATNYYLFSLAVSDLIYLIFGLPTEVFLYWHQYPYLFGLPFCKARAYISEASTYVSVLTIVAFSAERYLAICHPLHLYAMSGFKRALRIIALLWIVSFIGAIPFGIWMNINYCYYPPDKSRIPESKICGFDTPKNIPVFEFSSLLFFFIPMFLIFYFYGRMGAKIRSRTTQQLGVQQGSMHRESRHQQSRKAVIRMLAAVVLTFFICWLPFHIQRLWFVHGKTYQYYQEVNEWLFSITGFAYYVTCTINPILYNVMSHRYRVAFKDTLCGKRKSVYYNNGFCRDQSSFRETTIASSLYNNSTYDRVHSVRVRSVRIVNNAKDRSSTNSNNILWKKSDFNMPIEKDIPENHSTNFSGTNAVVVCVDNGINGRTKVFTENEAQETLLNKNNETCI